MVWGNPPTQTRPCVLQNMEDIRTSAHVTVNTLSTSVSSRSFIAQKASNWFLTLIAYMFNTACQLLIKILKSSYALVGAVYNDMKTSLYSKKMRTPEGRLSAIYLWRGTILPPRLAPPPSPAPLTLRHSRG